MCKLPPLLTVAPHFSMFQQQGNYIRDGIKTFL